MSIKVDPDDLENSDSEFSEKTKQTVYSRIKFEEDIDRYKAAVLHLAKTYHDPVPDFNHKIIAKMLKVACGRRQKADVVQRVLQSFERNIEKVKNDIKTIRENVDTKIKPLIEREELMQIKNAVETVMLEKESLLKNKNYKYPPSSAVQEILTKLGYENHDYHFARMKVVYHAYKWMNKNINLNQKKKVKPQNNSLEKEALSFENYFYVHYPQNKSIDLTTSRNEERALNDGNDQEPQIPSTLENYELVKMLFEKEHSQVNNEMKRKRENVFEPVSTVGELKICHTSTFRSSCAGSEEVFICVEKVNRNDIKIKFYELDESDVEIWSDYGLFTERNIHHNYTIGFRTPPYKTTNITSSKIVYFKLERPSDGECSNSVRFIYEPIKPSNDIKNNNNTVSVSRFKSSAFDSLQVIPKNMNCDNKLNIPAIEDFSELICDNESFNSEDIQTIISDMNMNFIDEYQDLVETELSSYETDGEFHITEFEDDKTFAADSLIKILNIMKENPVDEKSRIIDLLKDLTPLGETPLHIALRYNQTENIEALLTIINLHPEFKSLVDVKNCLGKTPLHYAVIQNQPEVVKSLLLLGASPNLRDDNDSSPLHVAVTIPEGGACVDLLLSFELNLETPNQAGLLPLHLASGAGSLYAVQSLLRAGAIVNSTDVLYGRTALHIAIESGHKHIVEFLLKETNIDVKKRNFLGKTAIVLARNSSSSEGKVIYKLLTQYGANASESDANATAVDYSVDINMNIDSDSCKNGGKIEDILLDHGKKKFDFLDLLKAKIRNCETEECIIEDKAMEDDDVCSNVSNEDVDFALKFMSS